MEYTENLNLHLPTFEDKADARLIADDNQKIDTAYKGLDDNKANTSDVVSNNDYNILRLDGGNELKGGENVFELPVGVYWTHANDITQTIINRPPDAENRSIITVISSNGLNNGWNTILWQGVKGRKDVIYTTSSYLTEGTPIWNDWQEIAMLSNTGATGWDDRNFKIEHGTCKPVIYGADVAGDLVHTYSDSVRYVRQGRLVTIFVSNISINNIISAPRGALRMKNFPFIPAFRTHGTVQMFTSKSYSLSPTANIQLSPDGTGVFLTAEHKVIESSEVFQKVDGFWFTVGFTIQYETDQ